MPFLILGLVVLWLLVLAGRGVIRANPAALAGLIRNGGAALSLAGVALALLRGQLGFGAGLLAFAVWLFTGARRPDFSKFAFDFWGRSGGGASGAASAWIEMQLDHDSGEMSGRVLQGRFAGRALAFLSEQECLELYGECLAADAAGARYLEVYFDRRFPAWRQAANAGAGNGAGGQGGRARGQPGMTEQEAYQVLGIEQGASAGEIGRAHRTLMKECHPDHGGTAERAARVNEARDVLLRRHQ